MRSPQAWWLGLVAAGCTLGPGPRVRTGIALRAPVALQLQADGTRSFRADVVVRNPARERLNLSYGCGIPVQLQYEAQGRWYPALQLPPIDCVAIGMAQTLGEGDSLRFPVRYDGIRAGVSVDSAIVRWLGPLPGRYRFVASTEGERRRGQRWRGGREVRLESRAFGLDSTGAPSDRQPVPRAFP